MSIFGLFCTSFFYSLERRFFVVEYRKGHFPMLYCRKKKMEKWPFLVINHGLTPFEKCQFFDFLKVFFRKRHFFGLYCIKKVGKMAIFGPKPWMTFGKMSIFRLFELLVFLA